MLDVTHMADHLRKNAGRYFGDLARRHIQVDLAWAKHRWGSSIYRFNLKTTGHHHSVIVKVPVDRRTSKGGVASNMKDRPRLKPLTDLTVKFRFEHRALSAIHEYFVGLSDPRFGSVRTLELLPDNRAIVMEYAGEPTLRKRLLKVNRFAARHISTELKTACRNAGAWLRAFHQLPSVEHTRARPTSRRDFVDAIREFTAFLSHSRGNAPFFQRIASITEAAASELLPESLPLGMGHGDYAPRNIFVSPAGQVTAFDTLARWRVPIYEDIGWFLLALKASAPQVYSQGLLFCGDVIAECEEAFLRGYFPAHSDHEPAVRLFELQALLNRWSSLVHAHRSSSGLWRIARGCRLSVIEPFFHRYAKRLLRQTAEPHVNC